MVRHSELRRMAARAAMWRRSGSRPSRNHSDGAVLPASPIGRPPARASVLPSLPHCFGRGISRACSRPTPVDVAPFRHCAAGGWAFASRRRTRGLPVLLLCVVTFNGMAASALPPAVQVGQPAPVFTLPAVRQGEAPIALADHRGKVVYLDFWSVWCEPCRRTMPALAQMREAWPREEFEVLALNQDTSRTDALRFLEQASVGYPVALDLGGATARRYGVTALPAAVVIDRGGILRHVFKGPQVENSAFIRQALARLLGQPPGS